MTIGILLEPTDERRVSLLPEHVAVLTRKQVKVLAEDSCGANAFVSNEAYVAAGAEIHNRQDVLASSDILLGIHLPEQDLHLLREGIILLGTFQTLIHASLVSSFAERNITLFSMDMLPRTTRAQTMDVLSSQANIAGYRAVLTAALHLPRYFPMFMTAAGSIAPAKVLVLGAGVAGLQAIATARRLGAVVEVFDTRPAVKEEVMSLGAKFIEVEGARDASAAGGYAVEQTEEYLSRQRARIAEAAQKADVIITTAQIPGKKAPILLPATVLDGMKPGSIIIDLASATGGNTPQTVDRQSIRYKNITIIGNSHLASEMPSDASKLYGKNILNFLNLIIDEQGQVNLNFEDDLVSGACISINGEIRNERVREVLLSGGNNQFSKTQV